MSNYYLSHSAAELDEAVEKVLTGYKDVSSVTATGNDVVIGKTIVDSSGKVITGSLNTDQFYSEGYTAGVIDGNNTSYSRGYDDGYDTGYDKGLEDATPILQSKEVIPSLVEQTITADTGFDGLLSVFVQAVPKSILDAEYQKGYAEAFELYKPYKCELPYIESTGTQYIDMGFKPNQNTKIVIDVQGATTSSGVYMFFGTGEWMFGKASSSSWKMYAYWNSVEKALDNGTVTNFNTRRTITMDKQTVSYGSVSASFTYKSWQSSYNAYLFAVNNSGTTAFHSPIKVYSTQVYDNTTLIRDYIPVLDWDDVPCMYDKVGRKLYYNAGNGEFYYEGKEPVSGTKVNTLAVGSSVYLTVNNVLTEFIIINQGIPSSSSRYDTTAEGTWLIQKNAHIKKAYSATYSTSANQSYNGSDADNYLTGTYLPSIAEKSALQSVSIPVSTWTSSNTWSHSNITRQVFLPSANEIGWTSSLSSAISGSEGGLCSYFVNGETTAANNKRIAYYNGSAVGWWTRTVNGVSSSDRMRRWYVRNTGARDADPCYGTSYYIRPVVVLKTTATVDDNKKVMG